MTSAAHVYASGLRHNSLKTFKSIFLTAALIAGLTLSNHTVAWAGNENGGSMYFKAASQPVLREGRAAARRRFAKHLRHGHGGRRAARGPGRFGARDHQDRERLQLPRSFALRRA